MNRSPQLSIFDPEIARERVGAGESCKRHDAHRSVPYSPESDTSKAAAIMVAPFVTENEERVEGVIRAAGPRGATASEIMAALGTTNPNNVRPRCTGLRDKGRIADSGLRRKAHDEACAETVWVIA